MEQQQSSPKDTLAGIEAESKGQPVWEVVTILLDLSRYQFVSTAAGQSAASSSASAHKALTALSGYSLAHLPELQPAQIIVIFRWAILDLELLGLLVKGTILKGFSGFTLRLMAAGQVDGIPECFAKAAYPSSHFSCELFCEISNFQLL